MPKHGTKNALFGYFQTGILRNYCHTWNQHPWLCQKVCQDFNSYNEFGIGSTIFKGPVSTFYLGASPDPVYKVCQKKKSIVVNQLVRSWLLVSFSVGFWQNW